MCLCVLFLVTTDTITRDCKSFSAEKMLNFNWWKECLFFIEGVLCECLDCRILDGWQMFEEIDKYL